MEKTLIFLVKDFEEVEAITTLDLLRRSGMDVGTVSLTGNILVRGSHGIYVKSDYLFENFIDFDDYDLFIMPGGAGTPNYSNHSKFISALNHHFENGKRIAAICAAPTILGSLNMLNDKKAVCYPGMESKLQGAKISHEKVVTDGNITTSMSPATAVDFALELIGFYQGENIKNKVAEGFLYDTKSSQQ